MKIVTAMFTGAAALAFFVISCTGYQGDFRRATAEFKQGEVPAGPWKGTWISEVNGHHGPIWCLVSQDENDPKFWNFRYRAGWGILQFGDYTHRFEATLQPDGSLPVDASMKLPGGFGTYSVKGLLKKDRFVLKYEGEGDRGTMKLSRP